MSSNYFLTVKRIHFAATYGGVSRWWRDFVEAGRAGGVFYGEPHKNGLAAAFY